MFARVCARTPRRLGTALFRLFYVRPSNTLLADLIHAMRNEALALSCGSGVTASVLALALDQLGVAAPVYDGSAAEWLSRDDTPIETGPVEAA